VPPIIVGGMSEAALARTAAHGDGWFTLPLPPADIAPAIDRLGELADGRGRPAPAVTGSVMAAIAGDPALPDRAGLERRLTDPDGVYGMPDEAIDGMVLTGGPGAVAERIAAFADLGAERVVLSLAAGDWMRQAELAAEAAALVT
jgi:alkanesulfonate monooxygenase SsuD/methylene tetrahydromethanopterin reductase-like flavin-dependent oxidoreductase (luciferase family)